MNVCRPLKGLPILALAFAALLGSSTRSVSAAAYTVTVDAATPKPATAYMQGFLLGVGPNNHPDPVLVGDNLNPAFWRLNWWERYDVVRAVTNMNPKITMILNDLVVTSEGTFDPPPPPSDVAGWNAWKTNWQAACIHEARISLGLDFPLTGPKKARPVDFWEVWNECDISYYTRDGFGVDWAQLLEVHQIAAAAIRSVIPGAKILGPSKSKFGTGFMCDSSGTKDIYDFIYELANTPYNTRLDGISWHELGGNDPNQIPTNTANMRAFLADPLNFSPAYTAEMHVNEYGPADRIQMPGWILNYLYFAEQADLDWFSTACWETWEDRNGALQSIKQQRISWSCCEQGIDGRFMRDMTNVQQPYLVLWDYKKLNDAARISTSSSDVDFNALASRNNAASVVTALVASHNKSGATDQVFNVVFTNYPYSSTAVDFVVWKYRNTSFADLAGFRSQPADAQPADIDTLIVDRRRLPVVGGVATYTLRPCTDIDVYRIEARAPAAANVILADDFEGGHTSRWTADSDFRFTTDQKVSGSSSRECAYDRTKLQSTPVSTTGFSNIRIQFNYRDSFIDPDDDVMFQVWNGTGWVNLIELDLPVTSENTWTHYSVTLTAAAYFRDDFQIRFDAHSLDPFVASNPGLGGEKLFIDDVLVEGW